MAATSVCSAMVNLEALTKDNYEYWSFRVKTYLLAEDLWDLVEDSNEPPKPEDGEVEFKAWRKNNARALQAITILCGKDAESSLFKKKDAESSIVYIETARDAWNTLADKFKLPEILEIPAEEKSEVESNDEDTESTEGDADEAYDNETHGPFFRDVWFNRWENVKEFIKQHPGAVRVKDRRIFGRTALHIAVRNRQVDGIKALLPFMKNKDLEIASDLGNTALSLAIMWNHEGADETRYEIVKCIVEKNKKLLVRNFSPSAKIIPLLYALRLDRPKIICEYLYSATPIQELKTRDAAELVSTCLRMKKHLDIALDLLKHFPNLPIAKDHSGETPLNELAGARAELFSNGSEFGLWTRLIYSCIHIPELRGIHACTGEVSINCPNEGSDQGNQKHFIRKVTCFFGRLVANLRHLSGIDDIYQMKLLHERTKEILKQICKVLKEDKLEQGGHARKSFEKALFQAVERGHAPVIKRIFQVNDNDDNLSWLLAITNAQDKTVFQFAAEHRQDKIFDLINYFFRSERRKEIIGRRDKFGNNMLHVVGKLSPLTKIDHIRGAALQMQHELQWFKKVESMASPQDLNCINSDGLTPREVFTVSHRDLVNRGESSMKETATSSSALVAALIITIMFAAAVTVPGGIKGDTGIPIYLHNKAFRTFMVADVISLCSSTTSVMVFLGILTSRFSEEDFLTSLPTKLIVGFFTLFLSIGAMMVAFSSAIFIMLPDSPSIVIPSIVLAGVPIASFLWMQFSFLLDIIVSTHGSRIKSFFRRILEGVLIGIQWIPCQILRICF